ncbi:hypothetical protein M670_00489 [Schinkia azotoformans MEV2011]|uniref:Uncharacterized protein n=1 Tax=Schinkia azotoformans MEV2011 TaxID=1348973 RepID=A0A072NUB1_SCHAZ|nr:hypothetical protein [Schinkia azotoformans]KEF40463.1 hypothetical protein M670_00489 [Schinkia azotoformans MEV2011]MEC1696128.1 hypothetical protein [Schinkia azotoformans]MEC1716657.1 hypothetical protein [Schinkia azotoformans]MEC1725369.1 hypothetical protein [Schinkia azotoformans]MEC1739496.1 hypothetical protein [Schinkia azotoformans]
MIKNQSKHVEELQVLIKRATTLSSQLSETLLQIKNFEFDTESGAITGRYVREPFARQRSFR